MKPGPKRRPRPEDVPVILERIAVEGESLRAACRAEEIHPGHMHEMLREDETLWAQYCKACDQRADALQERILAISEAAATGLSVNGRKIDPAGARVYLSAIQWAAARMSPKTAPIERVDMTVHTLSDEELDRRLRELETANSADAQPED